MMCHIVTEGPFAEALLRKILPAELILNKSVRLRDGGNSSSAESLAASILVAQHQPVILVADAGSSDEKMIYQRKRSIESVVGIRSDPRLYRVLLAVPELAGVFFEDEDLLRRHIPTLTPEFFIRGQYTPKTILQQLLGRDYMAILLNSLTEQDIQTLQKAKIACELEQAVTELLALEQLEDAA